MSQKRLIVLYGPLRKKFGKYFKLAVDSPAEAIRAISVLRPEFKEFLRNSEQYGLGYRVLARGRDIIMNQYEIVESLHMRFKDRAVFKIVPVPTGGKNSIVTIVAGVALIAASFIPGLNVLAATALFMTGTALLLGGAMSMLAPTPKFNADDINEQDGQNTSRLFNRVVNTSDESQPVPLVFGTFLCGSAVASSAISSVDVPL